VKYISKSKFLAGLQCPKLIWTYYNAKDRILPTDLSTQAIFDQGHDVGELAKRLYPNGIEVGVGLVREFEEIFTATHEALASRRPLFEPALANGGGYARADILNPVGDSEWDLIEVKSSTQLKPVNIDDIAFQRYVFEGAGVRIRNCYLLHINNQYVRQGDIDPQGLFTREDVTALVAERLPQIDHELQSLVSVIDAKDEPVVGIGLQCDDPYPCPLKGYCWADVPEHSVFTIYRLGKKAFDLYDQGIEDIASIPPDYRLSSNQQIQRDAVLSKAEHINRSSISSFLRTLQHPLYYLDFETINTTIPFFDGVRPFQQVPFQFSLHVVEQEGAEPTHHMFLADGSTDPRPEFMRKLSELLGDFGSIVTYNAPFEKGIMRACSEILPEYSDWFSAIETRIVDLLDPFRAFDYYHPDQHGSASIKAVLPVLTNLRYDGEIADGATASNEYVRVTFGNADEADRLRVRSALEAYCGLDTLAMVKLVERLIEIST
jgi:hypothetical protein